MRQLKDVYEMIKELPRVCLETILEFLLWCSLAVVEMRYRDAGKTT